MDASEGEVILNRGNLVSRIGLERRRACFAWAMAGFFMVLAACGWYRPVDKVVIKNSNDCIEYTETMCNN